MHGWGGNDQTIGNSYNSFKNCSDDKCNGNHTKESTLMDRQKEWLEKDYANEKGAFLMAVKTITGITTGKDFLDSQFVWDNLVAMDYDQVSYKGDRRKGKIGLKSQYRPALMEYSKQKLRMEFAVAKPKLAIFFIGHYADGKDEFWGMFKENEVENFVGNFEGCPNLNQFTLNLKKENVKIECYSTYHPAYPNWDKSDKNAVLKKLAEIIEKNKT